MVFNLAGFYTGFRRSLLHLEGDLERSQCFGKRELHPLQPIAEAQT